MMNRRKFCAMMGATLLSGSAAVGATGRERRRRALLIGVCDYLRFPKRVLEGPAMDVRRVRGLLEGQGVEDITILADRLPESTGAPTRANVMQAFHAMTQRVQPGDFLFFYFSGHGAQQPAHLDPDNPEWDELDEVLLPADAGPAVRGRGIQNAIVDDEIGAFLTECRRRGAFVWSVIDACHAGDGARAGALPEGAVERGLSAEDLGFPARVQALLSQVGEDARGTRLGQDGVCGSGLTSIAGGLLAFFATRSHQRTLELPLLQLDGKRRYGGLFTHVLIGEVQRLTMTGGGQASYQQLVNGIARTYREEWANWGLSPQFCADPSDGIRDRPLFD